MKPPPPTKPIEDDKQSVRRAAVLPVVAALAGIVAVAAIVYYENSRPPETRPVAQPSSDDIANDLLIYSGDPDVFLMRGRELLVARPGDQLLEGEPGGLPPPPGADPSQRHMGVRRRAMGVGEEVVVWNLVGSSMDAVAEHYLAAAEAKGFRRIENPTASQPADTQPAATDDAEPPDPYADEADHPPVVTMSFTRKSSEPVPAHRMMQNEVLVVRAALIDDAVRVLVWLRYPAPGRGRGAWRSGPMTQPGFPAPGSAGYSPPSTAPAQPRPASDAATENPIE